MRAVIQLTTIVWVLCGLARAAGASPRECVAANERGAELRASSAFTAAREQYLACADIGCPQVIREECARLVATLDSAMPTVVLSAVNALGEDVLGVNVTIDGNAHARGLDGRAIAVDPGEHEFRFEDAGRVHAQLVLIREGEKNRRIQVVLPEAAKPSSAAELTRPPLPQPTEEPAARPIPTLSYAFGGVGALALGAFGYFALAGRSDQRTLERCAPDCARDDANAMRAKYVAADVALGVAAVSLGAAVYFYVSRPDASAPATTAKLGWADGGARLSLERRF